MSRAPAQPAGPDTATYLYCVVESASAPVRGGLPEGLPETSVPRLLSLGGDLWLVVGEAPLPAYSAAEIERRLSDLGWVSACAVAHERVVAHFASLAPVVPMKLFTLFQNDARAVEALAGRREQIVAVLERVAGAAEWGVRVHFDAGRARRGKPASAEEAPSSGRDFLRRKKEAQEAARSLARRAGEAAAETFEELARQATAARRREPPAVAEPGPRLILDAAFLVPSAGAEPFERAVQAVAERLAESACAVTLTGPWPPYNFIEEVG
jgi:hypothetical protein